MRIKRWSLLPSTRPPDPPTPPLQLSHFHLPRPRQLSSHVASSHGTRQEPIQTSPLPPPIPGQPSSLKAILNRLPPISSPPRLNLRPVEDLEQQLQIWQTACRAAYVALKGAPPAERLRYQRPVARVVGQTMRILLRLGAVDAAKQLDKVFFTKQRGRPARRFTQSRQRRDRIDHSATDKEREKSSDKLPELEKDWDWSHGLGLSRSDIDIAWMSSFAVRLECAVQRGDDRALREFGDLLREMHEQMEPTSGDGVVEEGRIDEKGERRLAQDSCVLAFLTRKMGLVQEQLAVAAQRSEEAGEPVDTTREEVHRLLQRIKDAEANEVEVVSFALLETALDRLEGLEGNPADDPFFSKVEEDIHSLVGSLEGSGAISKLHNFLLTYTSSVERHAHILHLAIRFLLLRARHHSSSPTTVSPLQSAAQLYSLLLDLTRRVDLASSVDFTSLRQRQTSALYRTLSAHVAALSDDPAEIIPVATRAIEIIERSLCVLSPLATASAPSSHPIGIVSSSSASPPPPDPRLLGISTRLFRRLFFALTQAAPPTSPADTPDLSSALLLLADPVAPFSLLSRALSAMQAAREHDASLSPSSSSPEHLREGLLAHQEPLFEQPNLAFVLVRAALCGSSSTDSAGAEPSQAEDDTPLPRLSSLLSFIVSLERTSPLELGERRGRRLVKRAVLTILQERWPGAAGQEWRDGVQKVVEDWEGGRDWGAVKEMVENREREREKGSGKGNSKGRRKVRRKEARQMLRAEVQAEVVQQRIGQQNRPTLHIPPPAISAATVSPARARLSPAKPEFFTSLPRLPSVEP
ncbi:hypothetical protein JCM11641_005615 [Rhodosporidiobolus odoratus]